MKSLSIALLLIAACATFASAAEISGTLTTDDPTWVRPFGWLEPAPDCDLYMWNPMFETYYHVYCISAADDQPTEVLFDADNTTIEDTTLYLYCVFDPENQLENGFFYNDDYNFDNNLSGWEADDNVVLTPGVEYLLVVSTFDHVGNTGDFRITLSPNIEYCGPIASEAVSWGEVKSLYR